jgi:hypothetical protein
MNKQPVISLPAKEGQMLRNVLRLCAGSITLAFLLAGTVAATAGDGPAFVKPPESKRLFTPQDNLFERVQAIVEEKCAFAGCHAGANAPKGLDMSEEMLVANLVGVKSADTPWLRVNPGDAANSYLIKKLRGTRDIKGDRMPRDSGPLAAQEIAAFEAWIKSLPAGMKAESPRLKYAAAFPGLTLANLQTAETLEKGSFLYRIAHKFNAPTNVGFDQLFGLDGGSSMMTQLGFPLSNNFLVTLERSKVNATFEIAGKYRLLRETTDGGTPISAAIYAGVDWATARAVPDPTDLSANPKNLSRTAGERFALFAQLPMSKQLGNRLSLLAVPGILLNGNVAMTDEDPLITLGLAGRIALSQKYSLFAEIVPILSGDETAATLGNPPAKNGKVTYFDAFVTGLEIKAGGHVFHIFVSNSAGNTTNQYMSGGDFDFAGGDFRLGFNIYRVLNYPL